MGNFLNNTILKPGNTGCLDFDGVDDLVDVPHDTSLDCPDAVTLSCWVKFDEIRSRMSLICKNYMNYELICEGDGDRMDIYYGDGANFQAIPLWYSEPFVANRWYHITGTVNKALGQGSLYVNGELYDTRSKLPLTGTGTQPLTIGCRKHNGVNTHYTPGQISDVRVYNRVLSASEVKNLFIGNSISTSGLVGHWKLNDINTQYDSSGNGNNGTTNGATYVDFDGPPKYEEINLLPKYSLDFDGNYTSVLVLYDTILDCPDAVTMSCWVKFDEILDLMSLISKDNRDYNIIAWNSGEYIRSSYGNGSSNAYNNLYPNIPFVTNRWYHITVTTNKSTGQSILYINGVENDSSTSTPLTGGGTFNFYIGGGDPINGQMYDVRIYNRVLSSTEVEDLYLGNSVSDTGLVAQYKLNEGSGTTAYDSSGNNHNGSINEGKWLLNDRVYNKLVRKDPDLENSKPPAIKPTLDYSLDFDGVNDYVVVPHDSTLNNTNTDWTWSFWVYLDSLTSGQGIIDKAEAAGDRIYASFVENGVIKCQIDDRIESVFVASDTVTTGKWYHITATWDAELKTLSVYTNGVLSNTGTNTSIDTSNLTSTQPLYIGRLVSNNIRLDGQMDDVRIYNRVLSSTEAEDLYLGNSVSDTGLVAQYNFNEGSGTTLNDSSGNNNDGTINGAKWLPRHIDYAMNFDGVDDYVEVPHDNTMDFKYTDRTWLFWVYLDSLTNGQGIIEKSIDGSPGNRIFGSFVENNVIVCQIDDGNKQLFVNSDTVTTGKWYHITAVWDRVLSSLSVYTNGVLSNTGTNTSIDTSNLTSTQPLYIGKNVFTSKYLDGQMDDVRIYNRVLSSTEAEDLYLGNPVSDNNILGLVVHYDMNGVTNTNDITNNTLTNRKNYRNNGTIYGGAYRVEK